MSIKEASGVYLTDANLETVINELEKQMNQAAQELEFEKAAAFRDQIKKLKERLVFDG
jgi:excinuclease ABC subunit B